MYFWCILMYMKELVFRKGENKSTRGLFLGESQSSQWRKFHFLALHSRGWVEGEA